MALLLQAMVLLQPMALLKHITRLKGPPDEPLVDLPGSPPAPAVVSSTPRALARRPMTFLVKQLGRARGSGTRVPARVNAALCASSTPMQVVVTATKSRARLLRRVPGADANGESLNRSTPTLILRCPGGPWSSRGIF
jgi:hypothetical protein